MSTGDNSETYNALSWSHPSLGKRKGGDTVDGYEGFSDERLLIKVRCWPSSNLGYPKSFISSLQK
jgi:hypothetical protein